MAEVTEITVSRSVKINLGDYESTDIFTSMKAEVGPDESQADVRKDLVQQVERAMVVQVTSHLTARGRKVDKDYVIKRYGFGAAR